MIGLDCTLFGRISMKQKIRSSSWAKPETCLPQSSNATSIMMKRALPSMICKPFFICCILKNSRPEKFWVDVVCEGPAIGATVADIRKAYHDKTNVNVCLDVDTDAFNKWFLEEVEKHAAAFRLCIFYNQIQKNDRKISSRFSFNLRCSNCWLWQRLPR